ncbi:MAG: choice-of-anchor Q domain-containing protein [Pyrinomonadaceae bacterium]
MSDFTKTFRRFFPSPSFRASGLIAAFAFLICLFAVQSASAATFTVTTTADSGAGSLRAAVDSANAWASGPDAINFLIPAGDAGCTSGVCTITLTSGELAINSATMSGTLLITNSTGASNLLISGNNTSRVFFGNYGANLTINGVTITKGNGATGTNFGFNGNGGGILNNNNGTLTLTNSTVSGNTASNGGGIYNLNGKTTLTNSTVSGNTATAGGGIYHGSGTMTLTNSTVSGNSASFNGGILNNDRLNLTSVTVTQNKSTSTFCTNCTGGIGNAGGAANLNNTIVAGNSVADASSSPDFKGAVAPESSFNLIGNGQGTNGITNADANSNQVGSSASPIDPKLGPLADNGGATQTHSLLPGSPAINAGNNTNAPDTDQRGFARIVGGTIDIGAYESETPPCTYSTFPFAAGINYEGGNMTVAVETQAGCSWTATSNSDWITITSGASGNGNGTVSYTVAHIGSDGNRRSGSLSVAGISFPVNQSGAPCTYSFGEFIPAAGGPINIVKSYPGCIIEQRNQESVSWVQNGIAERNDGPARGGIVKYNAGPTVGQRGGLGLGIIVTNVFQASGCTYTPSALIESIAATGGDRTFTIQANGGCQWNALTQNDWITINLGSSWSGSGTVGYTVAPNTATTARTGTITVAGQTFTVNQAGVLKSRKRVRFF